MQPSKRLGPAVERNRERSAGLNFGLSPGVVPVTAGIELSHCTSDQLVTSARIVGIKTSKGVKYTFVSAPFLHKEKDA